MAGSGILFPAALLAVSVLAWAALFAGYTRAVYEQLTDIHALGAWGARAPLVGAVRWGGSLALRQWVSRRRA